MAQVVVVLLGVMLVVLLLVMVVLVVLLLLLVVVVVVVVVFVLLTRINFFKKTCRADKHDKQQTYRSGGKDERAKRLLLRGRGRRRDNLHRTNVLG